MRRFLIVAICAFGMLLQLSASCPATQVECILGTFSIPEGFNKFGDLREDYPPGPDTGKSNDKEYKLEEYFYAEKYNPPSHPRTISISRLSRSDGKPVSEDFAKLYLERSCSLGDKIDRAEWTKDGKDLIGILRHSEMAVVAGRMEDIPVAKIFYIRFSGNKAHILTLWVHDKDNNLKEGRELMDKMRASWKPKDN